MTLQLRLFFTSQLTSSCPFLGRQTGSCCATSSARNTSPLAARMSPSTGTSRRACLLMWLSLASVFSQPSWDIEPLPPPPPPPPPSPPLPSPPPPLPPLPVIFQLNSGTCHVIGSCFYSPDYPRDYPDNQECSISPLQDVVLNVKHWSV